MSAHEWSSNNVGEVDFDVKSGVVNIRVEDDIDWVYLELSCDDIIYIAKQLGMTKERFE